jgi:hypothetical protein
MVASFGHWPRESQGKLKGNALGTARETPLRGTGFRGSFRECEGTALQETHVWPRRAPQAASIDQDGTPTQALFDYLKKPQACAETAKAALKQLEP